MRRLYIVDTLLETPGRHCASEAQSALPFGGCQCMALAAKGMCTGDVLGFAHQPVSYGGISTFWERDNPSAQDNIQCT